MEKNQNDCIYKKVERKKKEKENVGRSGPFIGASRTFVFILNSSGISSSVELKYHPRALLDLHLILPVN